MKKELAKAYNPQEVEDGIYKAWEASGFFNPDKLPKRHQQGEPYCIMMPPPNVTGVLHLGHAFENALMDTMARFERMRGKRVLLLPGTDHAAIATQAKVEKMLMKQGMKNPRKELGREKLVEKIREFAEVSKKTILSQIRKVGTSCDWSRLAYTFDQERNDAVNALFGKMFKDGLIRKGYRTVNWSVKGQSTCSDDEIIYIERPAKLYTFKYSKDFPIAVSTTRPETKLGDTAVAVHPSDKRYKKYVGKTFTVDVGAAQKLEIKIIADENVDPKFGTGAVGVTPAHSQVDFSMYEKQKARGNPIGIIPVIGSDGKMNDKAGKRYQGKSAEEAREEFVDWLRDEGLLQGEPEDTRQSVGTSDRYGDVIEVLPMMQWWLCVDEPIPHRGKSLKDLMREALTAGLDADKKKKVVVTPERFTKLYIDRVQNLRDWCLSRQLWWGHRIPIWYKLNGDEYEAYEQDPEAYATTLRHRDGIFSVQKPEGEGWVQDPDTLDTWFSSGSWTFSTLGWPEKTSDLKTFYPTAWMQMGYEILYLWLMRMVLMSAYALDDIPFREAYIHGMLRDEHGEKFSKSMGNGIDPIDVIERYGADALRVSLLFGTTPGNDFRYYTEKIESGRNFTNKLWNISRYILLNVEETGEKNPESKTLADRWILSRLNTLIKEYTAALETYQFSRAGEMLRDFTWSELADWYVEIAKIEGGKDAILLHILKTLLRLWHPFMPFVTEQIAKEMGEKEMLLIAEWPRANVQVVSKKDEEAFRRVMDVITAIRNARSEFQIPPKELLKLTVRAGASDELLRENEEIVKRLARLEKIEFGEKPEGAVTMVAGGIEAYLELGGMIDVEKEKARLEGEIQNIKKYLKQLEGKFGNKEFVKNAPPQIVEGEKKKYEEAKEKMERLEKQLQSL